jgi:hypothetical protein
MRKLVIQIHGVNFLLRDVETSVPVLLGFYVNVYVEADSMDEAESQAVELVRTLPRLRAAVMNSADDPPRMLVEEIVELTDWPEDCVRPLSGLVFYDYPDAEGSAS